MAPDLNYHNTFISVADDSTAPSGTAPPDSASRTTVARAQYDMLVDHPYQHTQEDVLFETSAGVRGQPDLSTADRERLRADFFDRPQACLRASPLPKKFGWGLHFDADGRVAIYGVGSPEYQGFVDNRSISQLKAMRTRRASE